ncbi:MAG: SOS response-associated peptidase [Bacteroidetes bacterium]|nr:SOS response-associated peptidase [Bacteroidota bacterium]
MCGRYVQVSKLEIVEKRFNVTAETPELFTPNFNIGAGTQAMVITCEEPRKIQWFQFGYSPPWAKKQMYLLNARAEGDANKENQLHFTGGLGILQKPAFREAIRHKRCLVIADCFYEGSKEDGLNKPYVVYVRERKPIAFAGLYSTWQNHETGEIKNTFAIITTWPNELMHKIGHHRSPVILPQSAESIWLKQDAPLSYITPLLHPYPSQYLNAYPVSSAVKNLKNNDKGLVQPIGERIYPETDWLLKKEIELQGMGNKKRNEPNG